MSNLDIKKLLEGLSADERKKLLPHLSDKQFERLLQMSEQELSSLMQAYRSGDTKAPGSKKPANSGAWYDVPLCGLSKEGKAHLKELTEQLNSPESSHHVDRKQVRYLQQLKKMRLTVPDCFRQKADPKLMYRHLVDFCNANDIPAEIVSRVVPALVTYMETGHMRPIIFVGEKGCGKTTAIKLLVEEALHLPTDIIKIPHMDGDHGMTGDCGKYQSADVGRIAKARLRADSLLVAYVLDEIDKAPPNRNCASVADELLSITDESCCDVYDSYLETTLVGLEHCPMFMTANDLQKISPILVDRCTVIHFPNATAARIKAISRKYAEKEMKSTLYSLVRFDYELMDAHIDNLVHHNVTSLRKHQQMIEDVLRNALDIALSQESEEIISITEEMFAVAEADILGTVKRRPGFTS